MDEKFCQYDGKPVPIRLKMNDPALYPLLLWIYCNPNQDKAITYLLLDHTEKNLWFLIIL